MRIDCYAEVSAGYSRVFHGEKYYYSYRFISKRNPVSHLKLRCRQNFKLILRGFELSHYGKTFDFNDRKEWHSILFLYPGYARNEIVAKRSGLELSRSDIPPDVLKFKKVRDVIVPQEIVDKVRARFGLEIDLGEVAKR